MNEQNTPPGQSITDGVVALNQIARQLGLLAQTMSAIFPRINGTFTLSGNATTTISQPAVKANSIVQWTPTNAAAATLEGSAKNLYLSALNAGSNFVLSTANAGTTAGTETLTYTIINPA